jgi:cupin 2 domain-containing protein
MTQKQADFSSMPKTANLFDSRPADETTEQFISLLQRPGFRLETIISHGQTSEPDFWYDQKDAEWVLLTRGRAVLEFENRESCELSAGDYLLIPARCKHRVSSCSDDAVWLALHFSDTSL